MSIQGIIKKDKKTKKLINRINQGDIALICHKDLDELAAIALKESKVKCIINTEKTISGKYQNLGPSILLEAGIPIYETKDVYIFDLIAEGEIVEIDKNKLLLNNKPIADCYLLDNTKISELMKIALRNTEKELDKFIDNTLEYAKKEKEIILGYIDIPETQTRICGKHVLIVARGKDYKKDLKAIKMYISEIKPVLIGVDGGGDALLESGYIPDIIIGDMDSVSDKCLKITNEIIVHAYKNGKSPGLERINNLGLESTVFSSPGTSEDIALLLAYHNKADIIVAVGTHNNMIDFLEKGRKGMASTFLVRLMVGSKLVDAKGVNKLYKSSVSFKHYLSLGIAAIIPIIVLSLKFPPLLELFQLIQIRLKLFLNL